MNFGPLFVDLRSAESRIGHWFDTQPEPLSDAELTTALAVRSINVDKPNRNSCCRIGIQRHSKLIRSLTRRGDQNRSESQSESGNRMLRPGPAILDRG